MPTTDLAARPTQRELGTRFTDLHRRDGLTVLANPWDVGSARLFATLGFEALASTGGGLAFAAGLPDGSTTPGQHFDYLRAICGATALPVTADLEDGFGDHPDTVAETIAAAADCGVVGGSIEDRRYGSGSRALSSEPYAIDDAVARIEAAVAAANDLPFPFVLTARCDDAIAGRTDLAATIDRLQAYEQAGANCLYAPGLTSIDDIAAVTSAVAAPVNVVVGLSNDPMRIDELADAGVRRVTIGSALARVALGAVAEAAVELRDRGTSSFATSAMSHADACAVFAPWSTMGS